MSAAASSGAFTSDAALETSIGGLKNAHELEMQATLRLERQRERIENYPATLTQEQNTAWALHDMAPQLSPKYMHLAQQGHKADR